MSDEGRDRGWGRKEEMDEYVSIIRRPQWIIYGFRWLSAEVDFGFILRGWSRQPPPSSTFSMATLFRYDDVDGIVIVAYSLVSPNNIFHIPFVCH